MCQAFHKFFRSFRMGELFAFHFKQCQHQISSFYGLRGCLREYIPKARLNLVVLGEEGNIGDALSPHIEWVHAIVVFGRSERTIKLLKHICFDRPSFLNLP